MFTKSEFMSDVMSHLVKEHGKDNELQLYKALMRGMTDKADDQYIDAHPYDDDMSRKAWRAGWDFMHSAICGDE